jgi:aminoglycoside N3'-acetyltransferase
MIACGFERSTAIHLPEEIVAPDLYLVPQQESERYTLRDRHGRSLTMQLRRHRRLNRCFEKFEPVLEAQGRLQRTSLDGTPTLLCSHDALLDDVFAALARDPQATLAPNGVKTRLSG